MADQQPEALRLANLMAAMDYDDTKAAACELRKQHETIADLRAQVERLQAGGGVVAWMLPREGDECAVFREPQDYPFASAGWTPLYDRPPAPVAAAPALVALMNASFANGFSYAVGPLTDKTCGKATEKAMGTSTAALLAATPQPSPAPVAQEAADTGAGERDLMTKLHAQIRHLIDDLTTVVEDDGLTRYVTAHGGGMLYSNFINALIPLAKQLGAALAARAGQVAAPAMVPLTHESIAPVRRFLAYRAIYLSDETVKALVQCANAVSTKYLQQADLQWLLRFKETTEDDESFDVPKDAMKRLAELGVVRNEGFGRYSITSFGSHVADAGDQFSRLPLKTHADHEADYRAAYNAKLNGLTVGGSKAGGRVGK